VVVAIVVVHAAKAKKRAAEQIIVLAVNS